MMLSMVETSYVEFSYNADPTILYDLFSTIRKKTKSKSVNHNLVTVFFMQFSYIYVMNSCTQYIVCTIRS